MERKIGGGSGRGHMYTCGWFMLMYGRSQHNIVKQLSSNLKKIKNNLFPWLKGDRLDLTCDLDLEELSLLRTSGKNKWVLGCGFLRMVLLFMCYYVSVSYKISFSKKYPMLEKVGKPLDWNHCFLSALTHSDSSTSSDKKGECLLKQPKAPNYNT